MLGEKGFVKIREGIADVQLALKTARAQDLVDPTARLRQINKHIEELNEAWSNTIKSKLEVSGNGTLDGSVYTAELHRSSRSLLDTEKVKAYLGKQLPKFMYISPCIQLRFKPRE